MLDVLETISELELELRSRVSEHLSVIYPNQDIASLTAELVSEMAMGRVIQKPIPHRNHWDQGDVILITYGLSLIHISEPTRPY